MKQPLTGQYKFNPATGQVSVVGSKATEGPPLERQASLLQWGEDQAKLWRWHWLAEHTGSLPGVSREPPLPLEELLTLHLETAKPP